MSLGNASLPLASVIAESGIDVIGVDVDRKKCDAINQGINPI
jgi:UDP-N-acetyl-D-mannosaminuronic acid dehydrogenase